MYKKHIILNLLLIVVIVAIDQITKYIMTLLDPVFLVDGFFKLALSVSVNPNFAFSIPAPLILVWVVTVAVFTVVVIYWWRLFRKCDKQSFWLAAILGGAIGNIFDRIDKGGVIDWVELSVASITWSSFNLADVAIFIGALGWLITSQKRHKKNKLVE